jgi:hypothetical protein
MSVGFERVRGWVDVWGRSYPDINRLQGFDPVTNTQTHSNEKCSNVTCLCHTGINRHTLKHNDVWIRKADVFTFRPNAEAPEFCEVRQNVASKDSGSQRSKCSKRYTFRLAIRGCLVRIIPGHWPPGLRKPSPLFLQINPRNKDTAVSFYTVYYPPLNVTVHLGAQQSELQRQYGDEMYTGWGKTPCPKFMSWEGGPKQRFIVKDFGDASLKR